MAAAAPQATPQRPLPGGFINTPAPQAPTIFAVNAAQLRQNTAGPNVGATGPSTASAQTVSPVQRGAKTINDTLGQEARFPALEGYITQAASGEYDLPKNPAWMPYQKIRDYSIPPRLLEQTTFAGVETHMGILPALGHAWLSLDNCLYLWDYTLPNPELIGWEESTHPISAIKLVKPKPGVFIADIEHLLVVVTSVDLTLLGVALQTAKNGAQSVQLYNTRMSIQVRGLDVNLVEHFSTTGRIFFTSSTDDNIYEFYYQQEESWFSGRTACNCVTQGGYRFFQRNAKAVTQLLGGGASQRTITRLAIDESRNIMYTIHNGDEIKVWTVKNDVQLVLSKSLVGLLQNTGNFSPRTELLTSKDVRMVSISTVPAAESDTIGAVATMNNGCRLYLSVVRGYGYKADAQNPPTSMQVFHVRFPPKDDRDAVSPPTAPSTTASPHGLGYANIDSVPHLLKITTLGDRLPPAYFLAVSDRGDGRDAIFCAASDAARAKYSPNSDQLSQRFVEYGMWFDLPGRFYQIMPMTPSRSTSAKGPSGFGNELARQFDEPSFDIALVTDTGIRIIRRRRLVDVFATIMKFGSSNEEGREGEIKRFVRLYGRAETAATALAVACGQGVDVSPDFRLNNITEPEILEGARKAFIEYGGKPEFNSRALSDNSSDSQIDNVRPSPRHEGLALYIARLVRSIWDAPIMTDTTSPVDGSRIVSNIKTEKLRSIQRDLNSLNDFLEHNKSFIEGLAGPHAITRVGSRQEEIAMQGEHRAMNSLILLISRAIEGISFALVLFDERIEAILAALSDESRSRVRELRYQDLFVSTHGRELARVLVKAIVNHNIANGGNVDTVAEALRRRCGSFCSADDVVIFKAQEQVKRASESGSQSETGRVLLNESQRLFQKVAGSLTMEHLHWATERYVEMLFYAGAIQLCLVVAGERDRAKRALAWLRDGMPENDDRQAAFDSRKQCYDLVFATIEALDKESSGSTTDGAESQKNVVGIRRMEAYDIVNRSDDAVFQTCLYDWYVSIGQANRLLDIDSQYVVDYLTRRSREDRAHADLLWRYWAHQNDFLRAAAVQLDLARSFFDLRLEERIEYVSRARTNASTRQVALIDSRQNKQQLLREISDLLDIGNIQDDVLQRMKSEPRLKGDRRTEVLRHLNGPILSVDELFNQYIDQAGYYDLSLQMFQITDHRNPADIRATWQNLIDQVDDSTQAQAGQSALPWEIVGEKVRELGRRLDFNEVTFPVPTLLPMLERWAIQFKERGPPANWAIDLFLDLDIAHERLLPVLEQMFYGNEQPFTGSRRRIIAGHLVYLFQSWLTDSDRRGERIVFGNMETARAVCDCLANLIRGGELDRETQKIAENLAAAVHRALQ